MEEKQNHDDRQKRAEPQIELNVGDRMLDKRRVVGRNRNRNAALFDKWRERRDFRADRVRYRDRVGARLLSHHQRHRAFSIHRRERTRFFFSIDDLRDVAHANPRAADSADQNVGNFLRRMHFTFGFDRELSIAHFDTTGRKLEVLRLQ